MMAEVTLKIDVDTSELERAKAEFDLVSRKDVRRMIREALSEAWSTWPVRTHARSMYIRNVD